MELSRKSCRICLTESEFNVSLYGNYCQRTNMIDKILVCLKLVIEETDTLNTICYKCAENIERYYDFILYIKKCQTKLEPRQRVEATLNRRVTSFVREQVIDTDYSFSFLEIPEANNEPKPQSKPSSPFFSYYSPLEKKTSNHLWKTPRDVEKRVQKEKDRYKREDKSKREKTPRHNSRDLFESQSQDVEDEPKFFNWKLTPDDNILKRVRDKCFGRPDF